MDIKKLEEEIKNRIRDLTEKAKKASENQDYAMEKYYEGCVDGIRWVLYQLFKQLVK